MIGTEMLSERVRLQLAGRAGRQGDPGSSQFYISLEDSFVTGAMTGRFQKYYRHKVAQRRAGKQIVQLHGPRIRFSLWMLKNRVADNEENQRTQTNKYETTLRLQRHTFYDERSIVLNSDNLQKMVDNWTDQGISYLLDQREQWDPVMLKRLINHHFTFDAVDLPSGLDTREKITHYLKQLSQRILDEKSKVLINSQQLNEFYRKCLLLALDSCWTDQMDYLTKLRSYVGNWGLAGRDSGYVYNEQAYNAYQKLLRTAKMRAVDNLTLSTIRLNEKNQLIVSFI